VPRGWKQSDTAAKIANPLVPKTVNFGKYLAGSGIGSGEISCAPVFEGSPSIAWKA